MTLWVKNSGSWVSPYFIWVKNGGTWQKIYALWVKDAGSWKKVFPGSGTITITSNTTWTVPAYETLTVECYGGGAGGGGGGANDGFSFGSWGGQGGFGGQTTFASSTPVNAFGGIGGSGGTDGVAGDNNPKPGTPGGGNWTPNTWGLCRAGASSGGAGQGTVGGQSLYPITPAPNPISITFTNGQIIADGGAAGGAAGAGGGSGVVGGRGGNGGYTRVTFSVRDSAAPQPNTGIAVTVGGGGGGGGGAFDSGAQGQTGSSGTAGKVVLTWS
jgi:hypothetical protein